MNSTAKLSSEVNFTYCQSIIYMAFEKFIKQFLMCDYQLDPYCV